MTEWFCYVTCFTKVFLLLFVYSLKHDIFIIKKLFHNMITHIQWDVIISSSLRLLLNVWIWYRCQNRIENYYQHDGEQLSFYENGIPKKWDQEPIRGTWGPSPGTRDPGPIGRTRDLYVWPGTWDPPPATRNLGPYMWDPIWNRDPIPLRDTYINTNSGILTLIQLSLNMQFSSVA